MHPLPYPLPTHPLPTQVGLPQGADGLSRLLNLQEPLRGVAGFSTGNDQFSAFAPTALGLLHAAVSHYAFIAGARENRAGRRVPLSSFPGCGYENAMGEQAGSESTTNATLA